MINISQMKELIIVPTLKYLSEYRPSIYSDAAVNLLIGTALVESHLTHLIQLPNGPAVSIFQMEPNTHDGLWTEYISQRDSLASLLYDIAGGRYVNSQVPVEEMISNLAYATAMARLYYWRIPEALPDANDVNGLANYWKKHYNTELGAGHAVQFVQLYNGFIA